MGGLTNQIALEVGKPLEVYVLMTHPTGAAALGAWECGIVVPDNAAIWGYGLPIAGSVLISTPPAFMVGLPRLLPYEDVMHLMTLIITPLDCYPAQFFIQEYPNNHGITAPRYVDGIGDTIIELVPYPSGGAVAAFTLNPEALATSSASWDEVKALYQ